MSAKTIEEKKMGRVNKNGSLRAEIQTVIQTDYGKRVMSTMIPVLGWDEDGGELVPVDGGVVEARALPGYVGVARDESDGHGVCDSGERCECPDCLLWKVCGTCVDCQPDYQCIPHYGDGTPCDYCGTEVTRLAEAVSL